MRNTSLVTVSLPPAMLKESEKLARQSQMTRSEFMRAAIRKFSEELKKAQAKKIAWEEKQALKAISLAEKELKTGRLKIRPPGGLAELLKVQKR